MNILKSKKLKVLIILIFIVSLLFHFIQGKDYSSLLNIQHEYLKYCIEENQDNFLIAADFMNKFKGFETNNKESIVCLTTVIRYLEKSSSYFQVAETIVVKDKYSNPNRGYGLEIALISRYINILNDYEASLVNDRQLNTKDIESVINDFEIISKWMRKKSDNHDYSIYNLSDITQNTQGLSEIFKKSMI